LAADLSYKTVNLFNNNYAEFVIPLMEGTGTVTIWLVSISILQIIIENIFGVDYDEFKKTITIMPRLNESLTGKDITLDSFSFQMVTD